MTADAGWTIARFGGARLDRGRREFTRDGVPQALTPRAFDVLVALIEWRHRVVSKDDLIARCWAGEACNDGALARIVMNVRRSIGDIGDIGGAAPAIDTVRGVGYRFDAQVDLSHEIGDVASRPRQVEATPRLALLPLVNDTGDAGLAWIELGLASMLGKSLELSAGVAVVAVHDVLVALAGLPPHAPPERRIQAVRRHLDPDVVVCARMSGSGAHLVLHFELQRRASEPRSGRVAGADAPALTVQAGKRLAEWLLPDESASQAAPLDLGDPFLNETFARALQTSRENRLVEAAHLLDVVADGGIEHPELRLELARVHVGLGAPRADAEVEALRQAAVSADNAAWLAHAGLLSSRLSWQRGEMLRAGAAAADAAADAERAGRAELAVQCLIDAARFFGHGFDPRAAALMSRAIPQAERLGNRVLMRHAYYTAGALCGFGNDWIGSLRYHEAALAIANTMAQATRSQALMSVSRASIQLGRLQQGFDVGLEAFRCARISGSQPELGEAATVAAYGCMHARRMLDAASLFGQLQEYPADRSIPMLIARDVLLRSSFLHLVGRFDDALACIAATRDACASHPVYATYCEIARLRVLFHARRFDELPAFCALLRRSAGFAVDPRLEPWVERIEALVDHLAFGRTEQAVARLHSMVARLPQCEPQGRMALDLAWLHLERGEPALAEPLLAPLHHWLEQSGAGQLLQARLHHERGRYDAAVTEQRRFGLRHAATLTPFTASLLAIYEQAERSGCRQTIAPVDLSLEFEYGIAPWIARQLPAELGGPESSAAARMRP